jgi:hypothetical protein
MTEDILSILTRLEAGQASLISRIDRLEAGQVSLRADLMARIDRLQDAVSAIQSDIAVNFGASDTVKRAQDNTREELRGFNDILMAMVRRVRALENRIREFEGNPPGIFKE